MIGHEAETIRRAARIGIPRLRVESHRMSPVVRVLFDYSSPWAYLGTERVEAVAARCSARVVYQPFLLGGLFRAIGTPMIPLAAMTAPKAAYVRRELERFAARDGIPYRFPTHFPLRTVDALRLTLLVPEESRAPLVHTIMRAVWADDRDPADRAVLTDCARAAGLDRALVDRIADAKEALVQATDEALALGVPGAPTFQVGTELFWGQDRLLFVEKALLCLGETP
jgi:2-hydroxychromene-2-carboxylate isomerase